MEPSATLALTGAHFCTCHIPNEGLLLALLFLSATFGTRLGCTLVSARSSFQVRAWQSHAGMHGLPQITHRFVLRSVDSATTYLGCARTRPVLSRHGFHPEPCPRSALARGWYELLSSFCIASTTPTGPLPRKFHVAVAAATYHLPE